MKRRELLAGLVSGTMLAGPALASDFVDSIVRQLKKQGYRSVEQETDPAGPGPHRRRAAGWITRDHRQPANRRNLAGLVDAAGRHRRSGSYH